MSLIQKLEAASEGGRELDGEIFRSTHENNNPDDWCEFSGVWHVRCRDDSIAFDIPPHYTTSIDAALTLVPDGWTWCVIDQADQGYTAECRKKGVGTHIDWPSPYPGRLSQTPALALCIAALKAREAA